LGNVKIQFFDVQFIEHNKVLKYSLECWRIGRAEDQFRIPRTCPHRRIVAENTTRSEGQTYSSLAKKVKLAAMACG
jgi:hypothetical protein